MLLSPVSQLKCEVSCLRCEVATCGCESLSPGGSNSWWHRSWHRTQAFFARCESSVDVAPSQAFFLRKRQELRPLCQPLPSWLGIDTVTPCPGVMDPEKTQARAIYSKPTLTFRLLLATTHRFEGIEEKVSVFIPLEFKDD